MVSSFLTELHMQRFTLSLMFGILILPLSSGNAKAQDKEKNITGFAQKVMIPARAKGELIGWYFKPSGIVDARFLNNPRYAVFGPKVKVVNATLTGKKLRIELSIDDDGQGMQCLSLDGIARIGHKADGAKEFEESKLAKADETLYFDKGTLVILFEDYTDLHKAVPKKK